MSLDKEKLDSLIKAFQETMDDRVKLCDDVLTLSFDLHDPLQMQQSHRFVDLWVKYRITKSLPQFVLHGNIASVAIRVPEILPFEPYKEYNPSEEQSESLTPFDLLFLVARGMGTSMWLKTGAIHRAVGDDEKTKLLEEITQSPWEHVSSSPYETPILRPQFIQDVNATERAKMELAVIKTLKPRKKAKPTWKEWLRWQEGVEHKTNTPAQVAIPAIEVKGSDLDHLRELRNENHRTFRKARNTFTSRNRD